MYEIHQKTVLRLLELLAVEKDRYTAIGILKFLNNYASNQFEHDKKIAELSIKDLVLSYDGERDFKEWTGDVLEIIRDRANIKLVQIALHEVLPGEIEVANKYKLPDVKLTTYKVVYGGRGSPIGNRNKLHDRKDDKEREYVIKAFEVDMHDALNSARVNSLKLEMEYIACLKAIGINTVLTCYCKPKPCHLDVVKAKIDDDCKENEGVFS